MTCLTLITPGKHIFYLHNAVNIPLQIAKVSPNNELKEMVNL